MPRSTPWWIEAAVLDRHDRVAMELRASAPLRARPGPRAAWTSVINAPSAAYRKASARGRARSPRACGTAQALRRAASVSDQAARGSPCLLTAESYPWVGGSSVATGSIAVMGRRPDPCCEAGAPDIVPDARPRREAGARACASRQARGGPEGARPHARVTAVLRKLRQFQDLGPRPVLIVGDFTAGVGGPSGRWETRAAPDRDRWPPTPRRTRQFARIIDVSASSSATTQSGWGPRCTGVLELDRSATVARMLERDHFGKRYEEGRPIWVMESSTRSPGLRLGGGSGRRGTREDQQTFNLLGGAGSARQGTGPAGGLTMTSLEGTGRGEAR